LWIKGKAFIKDNIEDCCIEFDRKIKQMKKDCKPDISFNSSSLILPGSLDMHVHTRGMLLSYKEDIITATSEAAYGGVTTIVDMPNTKPYINTHERVLSRLREFENYSRTDYGIYSGVTDDNRVDEDPIAGYKIFPEDLEKPELKSILSSKRLKIIHPEIPISNNSFRNLREMWQELASLYFVQGKIHVTHATNYNTIELAKKFGFTVDFTPHHLLVSGEKDCLSKVNPPIRDKTEQNKLIRALFEADTIVSDHAPHTSKEKNMPYEICPPGIAAVSFTTPFVYTMFKKGIISLQRAVELVSKNPAKILGVNLGEIKEDKIANFTIISFNDWRYHTKFSKVLETPLDEFPLEANILTTIVEGKIAYDGEEVYPIRGVNIFDKSGNT